MNATFYRDILPVRDDAHYALWAKHNKQHTFAEGFDAFIQILEETDGADNYYFSTAVFSEAERKNDVAVAVKCFKLDLDAGPEKYDIDNPEKAYRTQRDAGDGLQAFVKMTGLMPTYVVSSGHGLHVYYALDEECTDLAHWKHVARALQAKAVELGLRADPAVTSDIGRLLRVIGSVHTGSDTLVKILIDNSKKKWSMSAFAEKVSARKFSQADVDKFSADYETQYQPYQASAEKMSRKCGVMQGAMASSFVLEYPVWLAVIQTVDRSIEGRALAHSISKSNAEAFDGTYDEAEVEKKLDSLKGDIVGCDAFAQSPLTAKICAKCPQRGKVHGPKQLGRLTGGEEIEAGVSPQPTEEEKEELDEVLGAEDFPSHEAINGVEHFGKHLPFHYRFVPATLGGKRTLRLMVRRPKGDDDEDTIEYALIDTPFYLSAHASFTETSTPMYQMRVWEPGTQRWIPKDLPAAVTTKTDELLRTLALAGVVRLRFRKSDNDAIHQYVMNLINAIRHTDPRPSAKLQLGFSFDSAGRPAYIQGRYAIKHDGSLCRAMLGGELASKSVYTKSTRVPVLEVSERDSFDETHWNEVENGARMLAGAYKELFENSPMYEMIAAVALGSIIMPFTHEACPNQSAIPPGGFALVLTSTASGIGKTTLLELAASPFYNTQAGLKVQGSMEAGGSHVARMKTAAQLGCMPNLQDEATGMEPKQLSNLIYALANGQDKVRVTQDGRGMQDTLTFSSVALISTNSPVREALVTFRPDGQGDQARIIEINLDTVPRDELPTGFGKPDGGAYWRNLYSERIAPYTGTVGLLLAREIIRVGFTNVHRRTGEALGKLQEKFGASPTERNFIAAITGAHVASILLRRHGVELFDMNRVMNTFKTVFNDNRSWLASSISTPMESARKLTNDLYENTLITEGYTKATKHGGGDRLLVPFRGSPEARLVHSMNRLHVTVRAAQEWCRKNNVSFERFCHAGLEEGWLLPSPIRQFNKTTAKHPNFNLTLGVSGLPRAYSSVLVFNVESMSEEVKPKETNNVVPFGPRSTAGSAPAPAPTVGPFVEPEPPGSTPADTSDEQHGPE
jgi:hypothetical protein